MVLVVNHLPAKVGGERHRFHAQVWKMALKGHGNPLEYSCLEAQWTRRSLGGDSPQGHRAEHDSSDLAHVHPSCFSNTNFISILEHQFKKKLIQRANIKK